MGKIRSKVVIALFLVLAAVVCVLAVYTSTTLNSIIITLNQHTQTRLIAESGSAMSVVSSDEINAILNDKSTSSITYGAVQNRLNAFIALHNVQAIYYAYKVDANQMRYIIGAGSAQEYNLTHAPVPINDLANEAFRGLVATTPLYDYPTNLAQPGALMAYTPIYDNKNEIIAIACVEISDTMLVDTGRQIQNLSLVFIGSILVIVLAGCANVLLQARKENILQQQLNQQRLMARISQSFISQRDINGLIRDALRQTGEFLRVQHVFLVVTDSETNHGHVEYSWFADSSFSPLHDGATTNGSVTDEAAHHAEEIAEIRSVFHDAIRQTFPYSLDKDHHMSIVFCSNTKSEFNKKYLSLAKKGIKSFAWAPIYFKGTLWGILSVENLKGRRKWNEYEEQLITSVSGVLSGIIARQHIEQERIAALERAIQANNAKSNFLSNMSHEMRTPMNAIMGMTKIAENSDDPMRKDYCLGKINEASVRLLNIINDILDMSTIESNELTLVPVAFRFEDAVREALDTIEPVVKERRQTLTAELDHRLPSVLIGDSKRFIQVITNLLGNAAKFTPDEGSILLKIRFQGAHGDVCVIQVEITDTGIGISEEQQKRLFGSFEQVESGASRRYGGAGLGLAISKHIIELMRGTIGVSSKLDEGSTFYFTFEMLCGTQQDLIEAEIQAAKKRAEESSSNEHTNTNDQNDSPQDGLSDAPQDEQQDQPQDASQDQPQDVSQDQPQQQDGLKSKPIPDLSLYRILLVEDIDINIEIVVALLEPTGIHIDVASNGLEALQKIRNDVELYDLIFMDMQMPEMDGLSATQYIRDLPDSKARQIPIIAMTANVFKEDVEKTFAAGMNDHIGKPINLDELIRILETFLPKKK